MGCHFLLQGIFPTQGSNPGLPHCRQTLYPLSHQGNPLSYTWVVKQILAPCSNKTLVEALLYRWHLKPWDWWDNWDKKYTEGQTKTVLRNPILHQQSQEEERNKQKELPRSGQQWKSNPRVWCARRYDVLKEEKSFVSNIATYPYKSNEN